MRIRELSEKCFSETTARISALRPAPCSIRKMASCGRVQNAMPRSPSFRLIPAPTRKEFPLHPFIAAIAIERAWGIVREEGGVVEEVSDDSNSIAETEKPKSRPPTGGTGF